MMQLKLYTIAEVAEYLRINEPTVTQLVQDGELGAYTVGDEYRFSESHIIKYLTAHEVVKIHKLNTVTGDTDTHVQEGTTMIGKLGVAANWKDDLKLFLNKGEIIIKMREASDDGRPAAEAIAPDLIAQFGNEIKKDAVKQLIGRLIKPVMEDQGYEHYERGVRCRPNPVFSVASSYRRA